MNRLLEIITLTVQHPSSNLKLIDSLSLTLYEGEVLALVGASGSGKSLVAQALFRILPANLSWDGIIRFKGKHMDEYIIKHCHHKSMLYIPESIDALDPFKKIGKQLKLITPPYVRRKQFIDNLKDLGLSKSVLTKYPFEITSEQARKVLLLIALLSDAELVVADKPLLGINGQVLEDFKSDKGKTVLFTTNDIEVAANVATRIAVMKEGKLVDIFPVEWLFDESNRQELHPYTLQLWQRSPSMKQQ